MGSRKQKEYIGYVSDKTHFFISAKEDMRNKRNRFSKIGSSYNKNNEQGHQSLLSRTTTSDTVVIEMGSKGYDKLPPEWADYYDKNMKLVDEIKQLQNEISKISAERVKLQFGNSKQLDIKLQEKTGLATQKLRECESNLEKIDRVARSMSETQAEGKIRLNIKRAMAMQISEITACLRQQQKKLFTTLTKYDNVSQNVPEKIKAPWQSEDDQEQDNDIIIEYSLQRDEEINSLVNNMNELAAIFKQLNSLVIDQGTLLDRIDANIESSQKEIKQSVIHLEKAKQHQESPCAQRTIKFLILMIIILSVIMVFKYTRN